MKLYQNHSFYFIAYSLYADGARITWPLAYSRHLTDSSSIPGPHSYASRFCRHSSTNKLNSHGEATHPCLSALRMSNHAASDFDPGSDFYFNVAIALDFGRGLIFDPDCSPAFDFYVDVHLYLSPGLALGKRRRFSNDKNISEHDHQSSQSKNNIVLEVRTHYPTARKRLKVLLRRMYKRCSWKTLFDTFVSIKHTQVRVSSREWGALESCTVSLLKIMFVSLSRSWDAHDLSEISSDINHYLRSPFYLQAFFGMDTAQANRCEERSPGRLVPIRDRQIRRRSRLHSYLREAATAEWTARRLPLKVADTHPDISYGIGTSFTTEVQSNDLRRASKTTLSQKLSLVDDRGR
ncbi:hypothetical protein EVAR_3475_1 [Eumeta japonica]|uniref:Uncharacterized protein n=1 Tax=Eumeta variegata TaxID=151549 RepID=A0A4C1STC3_EUMVA|nr:hypothetical protein EVAR_3475_1 [Eumeta japonica]